MALTNDYPTIRPSLLLDFARSRALDPRITFTRASIATRVNEDGLVETVGSGVPRFDFDPVTLTSKGLLIEEQRTNAYLNSADFSAGNWLPTSSTITTNTLTSPEGTATADTLTSTSATVPYIAADVAITSGTSYTFSIFLKAGTQTQVSILAYGTNFNSGGANLSATFNISTGTVISVSNPAPVGYGIQPYGNGWYRVYMTVTATTTTTDYTQLMRFVNHTSGNYLYMWGAQAEAGAFPTSYIPTTSASVQRNAEVASMTGTNFSSWYNAGEGTLYGAASTVVLSLAGNKPRVATIRASSDTNQNQNSISVQRNLAALETSIYATSVSQAYFYGTAGQLDNNTTAKAAIAYKFNDVGSSIDGDVESTDTSAIIPAVNMMNIGAHGFSGIGVWNGWVNKIAYYPVRLTNAQLQALTRS